MLVGIDQADFVLGVVAPQHEDDVAALAGECFDDGIGEGLPTDAAVTARFAALDGETGVEQQHALIRPGAQVAVIGRDKAGNAAFEFFVDVLQRGRYTHAMRHGKGEPHRLSGLVVGVLTEDDHAYFVVRGTVEGVKDEAARRVNGDVRFLGIHQDLLDADKVGFAEFVVKGGLPAVFDLYVVRVYRDFARHICLICNVKEMAGEIVPQHGKTGKGRGSAAPSQLPHGGDLPRGAFKICRALRQGIGERGESGDRGENGGEAVVGQGFCACAEDAGKGNHRHALRAGELQHAKCRGGSARQSVLRR